MNTFKLMLTVVILALMTGKALAAVNPVAKVSSTAVKSAVKGPLADCPSKPRADLDKIKKLGANEWLKLDRPTPDPKYGSAQGRAWSRKMAFAPDLRGAFIYGSGVHRGSTVRGGRLYFNDDLFFYDINANAWVCCHPGTPLDEKGLPDGVKYDPVSGLNLDKDGNIVPVSPCAHAYWCPEYDTDRKMFMFMPTGDAGFGFCASQAFDITSGAYSPYYYDGRTGKFERYKAVATGSGANLDTALIYSPKQKKAVHFYRGVWLYDNKTKAWQKVAEEGGGNSAYCYDSKRDQVYVVTTERSGAWRNYLTIFDIQSGKWIKMDASGDAGGCMESNEAFFTYDTANDVAVFHIHNQHHIYDPNTKKWTVMKDTLPEKVNWVSGSGFYDPELNAHFYFNAADSQTWPGNMWVYRYAPANNVKK